MVPHTDFDGEIFMALKPHGWPRLVVLETIYRNDDAGLSTMREDLTGRQYYRPETPIERYTRVLAWVESHLL